MTLKGLISGRQRKPRRGRPLGSLKPSSAIGTLLEPSADTSPSHAAIATGNELKTTANRSKSAAVGPDAAFLPIFASIGWRCGSELHRLRARPVCCLRGWRMNPRSLSPPPAAGRGYTGGECQLPKGCGLRP
jgi:hypothetical protein